MVSAYTVHQYCSLVIFGDEDSGGVHRVQLASIMLDAGLEFCKFCAREHHHREEGNL